MKWHNLFIKCPWWCHDMKMLSELLALCEGNPPVTRSVMWNFEGCFDVGLNEVLHKNTWVAGDFRCLDDTHVKSLYCHDWRLIVSNNNRNSLINICWFSFCYILAKVQFAFWITRPLWGEPVTRSVMCNFDDCFDVTLNKVLHKTLEFWWFQMPWRCSCDITEML